MSKRGDTTAQPNLGTSILDHKYFNIGAGVLLTLILILALMVVKISPDLSHLKIKVYSGSTTGNYYHLISRAAKIAADRSGHIENIATNGSMDNVKKLAADTASGRFALVQNGMPWAAGLELLGYLSTPETVFFLGPDADRIRSFADLRGLRIGIGPPGSGTAHLADRIFSIPQLKALGIRLSNHTSDEQLALLKTRQLDLGIFVISEASSFIEKAICEGGMQIASFKQGDSVAQRLPFLRPGVIREGLYDPIRNLPATDRHVLKVDTLVVANGHARRSQIMGMLQVMNELNPGFINYNRAQPNTTGLPVATAALDFFENQGPEIQDRYAPVLMDFIPLSSLVQLVMVISVFFNAMGAANRFRLWRIDANRIDLENAMLSYFGENLLPAEITAMKPRDSHRGDESRTLLDRLIAGLAELEARCRKQSLSVLVPMGTEMAYRYQEEIISKNLIALKAYREKFA